MKQKVVITLAVLTVVGLSLSGFLFLASRYERFIFTYSLQVGEFKQLYEGAYAADVFDGEEKVANIFIRTERLINQTFDVPVLVSIWHSEDTELDSLFLKFSGTNQIQVFMGAPGGSVPPFHFKEDSKGATVKFDDLGFYGTGTVTLNFFLRFFSDQSSFNFEVEFFMHQKAFLQLSRKEAWASKEIPIKEETVIVSYAHFEKSSFK